MFATYKPSFAPIWANDFLESELPDYLHLAHLRQAHQQQYERQVAQRLAAEEHRRQQKRQQQEEAEEQLAFLMHAARARAAQAQADLERRRRAAQVQQQQMRERERARRMMAVEQGRRVAAVAAACNPYRNGTSRRPLAGGERYRNGTSRRPAGLEYASPNYLDLIGDLVIAGVDSQYNDDDDVQPEYGPEEEVDISQLLYRLLGQREHVDEQVELKHKTPARNEEVVHVVADPEEVDLAAAMFAAATEDDAAAAPSGTEESGSNADVSDAATSDDESTLDLSEASLKQLSRLADDFVSHRRDFVSPTTLAFQSTSSAETGRSPTPPLTFGSTNAAFLGYEDYLVSLLSKIDAVESHGVPQVKKARKQLVKQVEQELAHLDHLKESAWEEQSGHSSASDSDESISEDASPEPVEVLTVDSESESDSSQSDASTSEDDHSSDRSSVSSPAPENESLAVKIPFLPAADRDISPALSDASSSSSTLNAGDDDVAEILLAAHRLGDKVQQLEEVEQERQELAELAHSGASDSEEMDDEEDVYFMYF